MLLVFILIFYVMSSYGMDNVAQKKLIISPILVGHSGLLNMLSRQGQIDFSQFPLRFSDGTSVKQKHINVLERICQPGSDYNLLSSNELIFLDSCDYSDYFQISSPLTAIHNALYEKLKTRQLGWKEIKGLGLRWYEMLGQRLIKEQCLDIKLLKPYSDHQIACAQPISNNIQRYLVEELLFFNKNVQVYGGHNERCFAVTPRSTQLFVKKDGHIQKEVDLRLTRDGYWLHNTKVHPSGLYALTAYGDQWHKSDKGHWQYICDYIDLTREQPQIMYDITHAFGKSNSSGADCFSDNYVFSAACYGGADIIVRSIDLQTKEEVEIAILHGEIGQEIVDITSNNCGTKIVVATRKTLFFITICTDKNSMVETKDISNGNDRVYSIKKISLNNAGTVLCVVMRKYSEERWYCHNSDAQVYLYHLTQQNIPVVDISDRLKGNHNLRMFKYSVNRSSLNDIDQLSWSTDDSLLILKCEYRYQSIYDERIYFSSFAGYQHAFVNCTTCNVWSENNIYKYEKPIITSQNAHQAIITDYSGWFTHTTLFSLYDEHMKQLLNYLNLNKFDEKFSVDQRFLGIVLLYKILEKRDFVIQLDKKETKIYQHNMPDSIKTLLAQTRTILMHEDNMSTVAYLKKWIYSWAVRSKYFLYECGKSIKGFGTNCVYFLNKNKEYTMVIAYMVLMSILAMYNVQDYNHIRNQLITLSENNQKAFGIVGILDKSVLAAAIKIIKYR